MYEVQFGSSIVRRVRRERRRATPHRRALLREFCIEQHIRCSDVQMVRSIPDTGSCVTASLSEVETSEFERRDPDVRVSTRRAKAKVTAVTVLGVEAWAVPVSPGTRRDVRDAGGSPVGRKNERVHRRPQYRQQSRAPFLVSRRLVQLHLQAEHR